MSDLFGNHIVGFPTRWLKYFVFFTEKAALKKELEDEYKGLMEKNQREMEEMQKTYEQRLQEAQATVCICLKDMSNGKTVHLMLEHRS